MSEEDNREEGTRLFIGGLSSEVDNSKLREAFQHFGRIRDAFVTIDRTTGRSRGFGFVSFDDLEDAQDAMDQMTGKELCGRSIRVSLAMKQSDRGPGGRGRGRGRGRGGERGGRGGDRGGRGGDRGGRGGRGGGRGSGSGGSGGYYRQSYGSDPRMGARSSYNQGAPDRRTGEYDRGRFRSDVPTYSDYRYSGSGGGGQGRQPYRSEGYDNDSHGGSSDVSYQQSSRSYGGSSSAYSSAAYGDARSSEIVPPTRGGYTQRSGSGGGGSAGSYRGGRSDTTYSDTTGYTRSAHSTAYQPEDVTQSVQSQYYSSRGETTSQLGSNYRRDASRAGESEGGYRGGSRVGRDDAAQRYYAVRADYNNPGLTERSRMDVYHF